MSDQNNRVPAYDSQTVTHLKKRLEEQRSLTVAHVKRELSSTEGATQGGDNQSSANEAQSQNTGKSQSDGE